MSYKLYAPAYNPRANKVLFGAALAGLKVEHVLVQMDQTKTKEHLARNPLGKVPVMETPQGPIFESNSILRFVARETKTLYGETVYQQSLVDQWLDFSNCELDSLVYSQVGVHFGWAPYDEAAYKHASTTLGERLKTLDTVLKSTPYLVGDKITIADVAVVAVVFAAFLTVVDEKQRKNLPNLTKWFTTVTDLPQFREFFGRPRNVKVALPLPKQEAAQQQQPQQQKQEKKPAAEKKKEEAKKQPAQEKPKKKEPQADDDEEPEKKKVNPLDLLPPSTFNIDDYKRQFFASKDIAGQMQALFDTVDTEGWSLWEVVYNKTEGEGKMLLKTNNTAKGFLQRIDPSFKKHSFAIWGVYGDEPELEIRGAWLWRGKDIPFEFTDHPSYEYHTFTVVDPKNEEQRKVWAEYWINQNEDESKVKGLTARSLTYWR